MWGRRTGSSSSLLESLLELSFELLESELLLELEPDEDELPELVLPSELLDPLSESEDESESEDDELSESDELDELSCLRLLRGPTAGFACTVWSSGSTSVGSMNFGRSLGFSSWSVRVGLALYTAGPVH